MRTNNWLFGMLLMVNLVACEEQIDKPPESRQTVSYEEALANEIKGLEESIAASNHMLAMLAMEIQQKEANLRYEIQKDTLMDAYSGVDAKPLIELRMANFRAAIEEDLLVVRSLREGLTKTMSKLAEKRAEIQQLSVTDLEEGGWESAPEEPSVGGR